MLGFTRYKIRSYEMGLCFREDEFHGLLTAGSHWVFDPPGKVRVEVVSQRAPWLVHEKLDVIAKSGVLEGRAMVVDLKDYERGLVWVEGRFSHVLPPGLYAYWTGHKQVRLEVVDARTVRFEHKDLKLITRSQLAGQVLEICNIERSHAGVLFEDGKYVDTLPPGQYVFWKNTADVRLTPVDLRQTLIDVAGQETITADKVTLRVNLAVAYKIVEPRKAVTAAVDLHQALYREAQLALRAVVGARELDAFLSDKDAVAVEIEETIRRRAGELGLEIASAGIRDVILPGDMKELMNKVTEARKAAEANLITRREETAAIRSQGNTAKLLADNPTLMRLRELEALEKIAARGQLNIVLGEQGLTDRIVKML